MVQVSYAKIQETGVCDHVWDAALNCLAEKYKLSFRGLVFKTMRIRRPEWKLHPLELCSLESQNQEKDLAQIIVQ